MVTKEVFKTGKYDLADSLETALSAGLQPFSAHDLIQEKVRAPAHSSLWHGDFATTSLRVTGRTKAGTDLVAYVHAPHYFLNPENLRRAVDQGLLGSAVVGFGMRMPQEEFQRLIDSDAIGKGAYAVSYADHRNLLPYVSIRDALGHPAFVPSIGSRRLAEEYLDVLGAIHGVSDLHIWGCDDLPATDVPLARLIRVGSNGDLGLCGNPDMEAARFVGNGE